VNRTVRRYGCQRFFSVDLSRLSVFFDNNPSLRCPPGRRYRCIQFVYSNAVSHGERVSLEAIPKQSRFVLRTTSSFFSSLPCATDLIRSTDPHTTTHRRRVLHVVNRSVVSSTPSAFRRPPSSLSTFSSFLRLSLPPSSYLHLLFDRSRVLPVVHENGAPARLPYSLERIIACRFRLSLLIDGPH
jgi:hypothetical protein